MRKLHANADSGLQGPRTVCGAPPKRRAAQRHGGADILAAGRDFRAREAQFARARPRALEPRAGTAQARPKILLVDDDRLNRTAATEMPSELGYAIDADGDGDAALDALERLDPDVLMTDLNLPGMSGGDLALEARRRKPRLSVIFASGQHAAPPLDGAVVLRKPYSLDALLDAVRHAAEHAGLSRASSPQPNLRKPVSISPTRGFSIISAQARFARFAHSLRAAVATREECAEDAEITAFFPRAKKRAERAPQRLLMLAPYTVHRPEAVFESAARRSMVYSAPSTGVLNAMPNIGSVLKDEISRLAKREIRRELAVLKKASAAHRRHIAALKRQTAALQRQAATLGKGIARAMPAANTASEGKPARFQARGLRSLRQRLGLSAAKMAQLLGVSELSVYNWETGKTTPQKERLAAIVQLRSAGKREIQTRLEQAAPAKAKGKRRAKARKAA